MERNAETELKAHLLQTSDQYRELNDQHGAYKRLVADLEGKAFLTPEEEQEEQRLKKVKLQIKDQMEEMLTQYRAQHA